jgi:uncharacterized iron-regulated membrane protein
MKSINFFKIASYLLFFTALVHFLSFFFEPKPVNMDEKLLFDLVRDYHRDLGQGFLRTTNDLMTGLSACFSLLCLMGGLINIFIIRKKIDIELLKGILNIELVIFGMLFVLMMVYTFLPPIICTGLIFMNLLIARIIMDKK